MKTEKKWPMVKVLFGCDREGCTKTEYGDAAVNDEGRLSVVTSAPPGWSHPIGGPRLCPSCAKGGARLDGVG